MDTRWQLRCLAIGVPGIEGCYIGVGNIWLACKFLLQIFDSGLPVPVEQPHNQTQGPHILAAQSVFMRQTEGFDRV